MPNDIKLQEGHPVDENLRPIKVGGKSTAIETAQHGNGARVSGDLTVTGDIKGNIKDMALEDATIDSLTTDNIVSDDLTIDDSGDITLDAAGGDVEILQADLTIPVDKKIIFGDTGEYITGDDTDLIIASSADIILNPATYDVHIKADTDTTITLYNGSNGTTSIKMMHLGNLVDYGMISTTTNGSTTIATVDADAALADLTLDVDGDITLDAAGHVEFDGCAAGFDRLEATFNSSNTAVDFRLSNKYRLEVTGDITNVNLTFPAVSGNFLLVCYIAAGGLGDHDVSNWKVYESDDSPATTTDVMWAGGSVPAFTTGEAVDIVSFYWDADEQQAYGVASLAFATP